MKTLKEIYDEMMLDFVRRTGVTTQGNCDLAARIYALAAQIYALQVQGEWVRKQSFPQTAEGEYLDRHAQMRGLERKPAACAQGVVRIGVAESANYLRGIPKGTVLMTEDRIRFKTTKTGLIGSGEMWVDVPVQAEQPGTSGNVPAGAITRFAVTPVSALTCINAEDCTGGTDEEDDEALRGRVLESFRMLSNGANAAYYRQLLMSDSAVAQAVVVPRPRGVGSADVYVSTPGGWPGYETLDRLQRLVDEQREIAVDVQVKMPDWWTQPVKIQVAVKPGYDAEEVKERVKTAIAGYFTGDLLGQDILRAKLGSLVYGCEGVENYNILAPKEDVAVNETEMVILGELTVEEMT